MTIAATGVTLAAIQTEFGGTNPIAVSEYVKGGSFVPANQATSTTDTVAIPTTTASPIRMGMFRSMTKTPAALRPVSSSITQSSTLSTFANLANAYDTTAASVDSTTAATLAIAGDPTQGTQANNVQFPFAGSTAQSGTLSVRYTASAGSGAGSNFINAFFISYSINAGTSWTTMVLRSNTYTTVTGAIATATLTNVVPSQVIVQIGATIDAPVSGDSLNWSIFDIVWI